MLLQVVGLVSSGPSSGSLSCLPEGSGKVSWATEDFIRVHKEVRESGRHNFQGLRIPIPTAIRYDRIEAALGPNISPKEQRVLDLIKYGMPLDCESGYGIKKT